MPPGMWITKYKAPDVRRYNLPETTQISTVFVSADGDLPIHFIAQTAIR